MPRGSGKTLMTPVIQWGLSSFASLRETLPRHASVSRKAAKIRKDAKTTKVDGRV